MISDPESLSHAPIAGNLLRLRTARALSQGAVAEAAGLSRVGYRNLESGTSIPRVETLQALARALEVPMQELVTPVRVLRNVRFRSLKRLNSREHVLAIVGQRLGDFVELEEMLEDRVRATLPQAPDRRRDGLRRAREAAAAARNHFDLREDEPVRDISGLFESNGIKVLPVQVASDAFFGLSVGEEDGGPAIIVNTWERISVERWIFTAAHELGHLILHLAAYDVTETVENREQEQEANLFASHFLMPDGVFQREWSETYGLRFVDRVLKVKRMFRVSYKTVLYRLSETTAEGGAIWPRFQMEWKSGFGRSLLKEDEPQALAADAFAAGSPEVHRADEPERLSAIDFAGSRLQGLVRTAVEREDITLARGAEVLGLSLSQMRELSAGWL
jgi:Zn-dependent peptidase ImmA (M78 family)/transcriptional regulator with XRE-family HTH domain